MKTKQLFQSLLFTFAIMSTQFANAQCQAGFTYTLNGAAVTFTDVSTHSVTVNYQWNFGDGNYDWTSNPAPHSYQYAGTYAVCLSIRDSLDSMSTACNSTFCDTIKITNAPHPLCNAAFTAYKDSSGNTSIYFYNSSPYNAQWFWNFGDGNTSTLQNPVHQYSVNSTYSVCLTAITTLGDTCTFCDTINSTPCSQLLNVSFNHSSGSNTITFTSNCSGAKDPTYYWDFGDGNYSYLQNPVHTFKYNGSYPVCLRYRDSTSTCTKQICDTVVITNGSLYPCNAMFNYAPDSMGSGTMSFYDQSTAGIVNWNWNFPGGTPSTSTASYAYITYPPGTYSVCLTVTNQSGITCSYCNSVNVGTNCNNTQAYFTMQPDSAPHVWVVDNMSLGMQPMTYTWNWGDGTSSTGLTPTHTYAAPGWYTICLTITDANGCGSSYCSHDTLYKFDSNSTMISVYVISSITGVAENYLSDADVTVYPNPASGIFTVKNEKMQINYVEVYNVFGEKVYSHNMNVKSATFNMSGADSGIYWLKLNTGDRTITQKLVLMK